jgi:hypothetical protein
MIKPVTDWKYLVVAGVLTIGNVALIWSFRFLPLYDYPIYLFLTKILCALSTGDISYSRYYQFVAIPTPNLAFTVFTWTLSWIVSIEVAGKLFLSLCVVGLPWSIWYSIRSLCPDSDPIQAYIGFPYSYNLFMFGGHNYLLGLVFLFCMIAYFVPRFHHMSSKQWLFLSLAFLVVYFIHVIPFGLAMFFFFNLALFSGSGRWRKLGNTMIALLPSLTLLAWYVMAIPPVAKPWTWGVISIGRNVLKPVFLLIKTYGIRTFVPLTLLNGLWFLVLVMMCWNLLRKCSVSKLWDKRFILPTLMTALLVIFLPDDFFGMWEGGARFVLPLMFFFLCLTLRVQLSPLSKMLFLMAMGIATLYNLDHFSKVDEQATLFYKDVKPEIGFEKPFFVVAFDWPAGRSIWDKGSASVNPLIVVPHYAYVECGGVGWIHESFLKLREPYRAYNPHIEGPTIAEYYASVLSRIERFRFFKSVAVIGTGSEAEGVIRQLEKLRFERRLTHNIWTILRSK